MPKRPAGMSYLCVRIEILKDRKRIPSGGKKIPSDEKKIPSDAMTVQKNN